MQKFLVYGLSLITTILLTACAGEPEGTLIKGNLPDAADLQVALSKVEIAQREKPVASTQIDADGNFALGFVEGLPPGMYQLKIGARRALLNVGTDDHVIKINGEMGTLDKYDYTVTGSPGSEDLAATMKALSSESAVTVENMGKALGEMNDPEAAAFLAYNALGRSGKDAIPVMKTTLDRLAADSPTRAGYSNYIRMKEQQLAQVTAQETIQVGQPAPDINLPDPKGKQYSLSGLKGQVVLLDFWASWCGPCRRENPNVVKVYEKYKDQGFTIFSVSLDGPDARKTAGMTPAQIEVVKEQQKNRWIQAIAKDNLMWPYHVSELKKWSSQAGALYGVKGIPKTFLIDREGNIAAVGLRGAASIERELQKVI